MSEYILIAAAVLLGCLLLDKLSVKAGVSTLSPFSSSFFSFSPKVR